uniref:Uncharacterized protein n=1 Tax=Xenopus tropicalis TaxID=8364 RepID=A0A1B8Y4Y0_XENTR
MASKTNVKTYEKGYRKNGKQQDSDASNISLPHKPTSPKTPLTEPHSLIAAEVARLINPGIEVTIEKAIDKLQINITNISEQLINHEKCLDEFDLTVSLIQNNSLNLEIWKTDEEQTTLDLSAYQSLSRMILCIIFSPKHFLINLDFLQNVAISILKDHTGLRKEFSKVGQALINRNINFSLMYPGRLKIFLPSGTRTFNDPLEAATFVNYLKRKEVTKILLMEK